MENKDKEYMRFIAACFAMNGLIIGDHVVAGMIAKESIQLADELLKELDGEEEPAGGIVDIVPKRKRTRAN
jgi:hypothetical protein